VQPLRQLGVPERSRQHLSNALGRLVYGDPAQEGLVFNVVVGETGEAVSVKDLHHAVEQAVLGPGPTLPGGRKIIEKTLACTSAVKSDSLDNVIMGPLKLKIVVFSLQKKSVDQVCNTNVFKTSGTHFEIRSSHSSDLSSGLAFGLEKETNLSHSSMRSIDLTGSNGRVCFASVDITSMISSVFLHINKTTRLKKCLKSPIVRFLRFGLGEGGRVPWFSGHKEVSGGLRPVPDLRPVVPRSRVGVIQND
jgi:hypothetical protein